MKVAYADPPYLGCSHYYPEHQEVDHHKLIEDLQFGDPHFDAWALSCSSPSLGILLNHYLLKGKLNNGVIRVASWVKPFCAFKPNVNPAYAWEPVIFKPCPRKLGRDEPTVRDWIAENITLKKGLVGAKPPAFCFWLFDLLRMKPEDEFYDLYPGTGIVSKCFNEWKLFKLQKQGEFFEPILPAPSGKE